MSTSAASVAGSSRDSAGREAILDCACTLFAAGGFAGTSMRALARAAHTSQALIHHHFGTKAGLYDAVRERLLHRLAATELLSPPPVDTALDPAERLALAMHAYAHFLRTNPEFLRLATWARLEGGERPWAGPRDLLEPLADAVRQAQQQGLVRTDLDANMHLAMVGGVVEHWVANEHTLCATVAPDETDIAALSARYFAQTASVIAHGASTSPENR